MITLPCGAIGEDQSTMGRGACFEAPRNGVTPREALRFEPDRASARAAHSCKEERDVIVECCTHPGDVGYGWVENNGEVDNDQREEKKVDSFS
jgi:hypothetical protein